MWTFLPSLPIHVHIPALPLPTLGTTLPSGSTNPSIHHDGVAEGSNAGIKAMDTLPSSQGPYNVFESIQHAYFLSALRMTGVVQNFVAPPLPPQDFWEKAKEYQEVLQEYIPRLLKSAALSFNSVSARITQATSAMDNVVNATATFREGIQGALDGHNITLDALTIEGDFMTIVDDLKKIPAPDKAAGHAERTELVDKVLDDTILALENIAARDGIEEAVETYLSVVKRHIYALIVAIGDINEKQPQLLPALLFAVAGLLIPESWFLRPFLRPLLSIFGFGPLGPVKGSAAARLQRRFWRRGVAAGSWFALLQAAGMGVIPQWLGPIMRLPWIIGALLAALLPCTAKTKSTASKTRLVSGEDVTHQRKFLLISVFA